DLCAGRGIRGEVKGVAVPVRLRKFGTPEMLISSFRVASLRVTRECPQTGCLSHHRNSLLHSPCSKEEMSWNATIFLNSLLEPLRASQFLPRRRRLHRYRRFHL